MNGPIDLDAIQAVIFDMDGVLIDSMPFHAQAWQKTFESVGLQISPEEVYAREGETGPAAVRFFLRQRQLDPTPELVAEMLRKKNVYFSEVAHYRFFDGVREFLDGLAERSKVMALVTGTSRGELKKILPPEFLARFRVVITSDDVQQGKPHPEPYQKALGLLGLKPEAAVVVENAPFGIQSARAAGLRCLAVETSLACPYLTGAEHCFKNIKELAESLFQGNGRKA